MNGNRMPYLLPWVKVNPPHSLRSRRLRAALEKWRGSVRSLRACHRAGWDLQLTE